MRSSKPHPRDASDAAVQWMRACSLTSIVMLTGTVVKFVVSRLLSERDFMR